MSYHKNKYEEGWKPFSTVNDPHTLSKFFLLLGKSKVKHGPRSTWPECNTAFVAWSTSTFCYFPLYRKLVHYRVTRCSMYMLNTWVKLEKVEQSSLSKLKKRNDNKARTQKYRSALWFFKSLATMPSEERQRGTLSLVLENNLIARLEPEQLPGTCDIHWNCIEERGGGGGLCGLVVNQAIWKSPQK